MSSRRYAERAVALRKRRSGTWAALAAAERQHGVETYAEQRRRGRAS